MEPGRIKYLTKGDLKEGDKQGKKEVSHDPCGESVFLGAFLVSYEEITLGSFEFSSPRLLIPYNTPTSVRTG